MGVCRPAANRSLSLSLSMIFSLICNQLNMFLIKWSWRYGKMPSNCSLDALSNHACVSDGHAIKSLVPPERTTVAEATSRHSPSQQSNCLRLALPIQNINHFNAKLKSLLFFSGVAECIIWWLLHMVRLWYIPLSEHRGKAANMRPQWAACSLSNNYQPHIWKMCVFKKAIISSFLISTK